MKTVLAALVLVGCLFGNAYAGETVQHVKMSPDGKTFLRLYDQPCQNGRAMFMMAAAGMEEDVKGKLKRADGRYLVLDQRTERPIGYALYHGCWAESKSEDDKYLVMFGDGEGGSVDKKIFAPVDNDTIIFDENEVPATKQPGINI